MRLLYVLDNYWPHVGGAERAFKSLCEGMAARGHHVTVLTHRTPGTERSEICNGVRIERFDAPNRYAFGILALPRCVALAREADAIHAATFNSAPLASIASRLTKTPAVLTVYETWIGKWREYTGFAPWKARIFDLAERAIFAFPFDRYVGISRSTSERLRTVVKRAASRETTIFFDFDPAPWQNPGGEALARAAYASPGAFLIVGYGRPGTSKGFGYLVDAFPAIRRSIPSAELVLVLSEARQYASELRALKTRASGAIRFVASLDFPQLVSLVRAADCVVVPSLTEGFGYTTLEAAAAGVPVVASDTTSIPEVIGGRYLLVPPRDAAAICNAVVAVSRGEEKRAPLRTFPLKGTLDAYESLYERLRG